MCVVQIALIVLDGKLRFPDQKHIHIKDFFRMLTQNVDRTTFEVNSERVLTSSIAFAFLLHGSFA